MSNVLDFYYSSIGKKVLMSLTGLFLIVFLTEHLIGNLLLFVNDKGATYEAYGEFLVSNPLIRIIELFLFLGMIVHVIFGTMLWIKNRKRRPVRYKLFRLKDNSPFASRITIFSGLVIGVFLYFHLKVFFYPLRFSEIKMSAYELVVQAFNDPWYVIFYLAALLVLGYHLRHGFQSAFQTIGLRSKKYIKLLDVLAFIVWFIIPLCYAAIPVYFLIFHRAVTIVMVGAN